MKAIYLLTGAAWSAYWLHALTIGAAASMILAVMSRAALGHTGRALVASRPIAIAYLLLCFAALVRVFSPSLAEVDYRLTVMLAGALWGRGIRAIRDCVYADSHAPPDRRTSGMTALAGGCWR
jgi:uncharacterized protein involved in response to NO